jgi:ATP-binding cassette subfamily F protein uup
VLDEPTNDLDIESLELLEAALQDYDGTLLLVSHDRAFLDNVVTQTIAAEGAGRWHEYPGGYSDWLSQSKAEGGRRKEEGGQDNKAEGGRRKEEGGQGHPSSLIPHPSGSRDSERVRVKLNNKEARELQSLPEVISALETEQQSLAARMSAPDYFKRSAEMLRADQARNAEIEKLLMEKLERWEALEAKAKAAAT